MHRNEKHLIINRYERLKPDGRITRFIVDMTIVDSWYRDTIKESKHTSFYKNLYVVINDTTLHVLENMVRGHLHDIPGSEVTPELVKKVLEKYLLHLFLNQVSDMLDSGGIDTKEITLKGPDTDDGKEKAMVLIRNHQSMKDPDDLEGVKIIWVPDKD